MATFTIVAKNTNPLGAGEIRAGDTIDVSNGDIFIVSASADDDIKFESASGNPTNFEIRFEASNSNDFKIEIEEDLDAGIVIDSDVDLSDVDIDAEKALSVVMTAGDNVALGKFEGSEDGTDVITIGDGFSTDHDIQLNGGDNFLTIGDNASIESIKSDDGEDTIIIGDGLVADDIKTEGGDDVIVIGDNATIDNIETKEGDDSITIGDGLVADDIKTEDGNDVIVIGDNATIDKLETKDGDDRVVIGSNASIDDLDGGKGNDSLNAGLGGDNFEAICFMRGTRIETEAGYSPIERLQVGQRIITLDSGIQTIRWISSSRLSGRGANAPVRIAAGVLGNSRALWVSQQHRILMFGYNAQLYFGEPEVLVAAKYLVGLDGIEIVELPWVEYYHMMFDRHEIVYSEGIESESFFPGAVGMDVMSQEAQAELYQRFPSLRMQPDSYGHMARLVLKSYEAQLLAA